MTKPYQVPRYLLPLLVLALSAGLPGCSKTEPPAATVAPMSGTGQAGAALGPRAMGMPPFGSTYQEFVKSLAAGVVTTPTGKPELKAFEISPPQNVYSDIKSGRFVVQFGSPNTPVERYWRLVAVAKLPWVCGAEDAKNLFEEQEPAFKSAFEFTKRSQLVSGNGASLSGISKDKMLIMSVECTEQLISITYQYIDLGLFAYPGTAVQRMVENEYRSR